MRNLKHLAIAALATFGLAAGAAQAEYPHKPITIVVSFAAGGNADIVQRLNGEALSKELGVPVNVVNKPGGAHIPATMSVLEAEADGYTLFNWSGTDEFKATLPKSVGYHWVHGPEGVQALIQEGVDLYSPILDGLGLLHK